MTPCHLLLLIVVLRMFSSLKRCKPFITATLAKEQGDSFHTWPASHQVAEIVKGSPEHFYALPLFLNYGADKTSFLSV